MAAQSGPKCGHHERDSLQRADPQGEEIPHSMVSAQRKRVAALALSGGYEAAPPSLPLGTPAQPRALFFVQV